MTFRTSRPVFLGVLLDLQSGAADMLIVSDESRLAREWRDGLNLLDACRVGGASVLAPDDEGGVRWLLTKGGTRAERSALQDRIDDARKYAEDITAKVTRGRKRWAGRSYQGGRRPFGYQVDKTTKAHERNLLVDLVEAANIENAARDLLARVSLKAVTRDLRERGVPTVTGAAWTTSSVRDMLLKPAVAGLARRGTELVAAPWEPILDRATWDRLHELLTDPRRRTTSANEPRWLVSGFATCGVCGKALKVGGAGRGRSAAYVGTDCGHVRRVAAKVDELVTDLVLARLEEPDAADLLRPRPRASVDRAALTRDLTVLRERSAALSRQFAAGALSEADLAAGGQVIRGQEAAILARLEATDEVDPLAEFRGQPARAVWARLSLPRRRAVVQLLLSSVVIQRSGKTGRVFDDRLVAITWRPQQQEVAA
jgi:DNA invertase Pin-like site-specific DNA recombinase